MQFDAELAWFLLVLNATIVVKAIAIFAGLSVLAITASAIIRWIRKNQKEK